MPNWCYNTVQFEGSATAIEQLAQCFEQLAATEKKENRGQLPSFITATSGYFFHIHWLENVLAYATRWAPNGAILLQVADHFQVDFIHRYDEPGMQIFGETTYRGGIIENIELEQEDCKQYSYDEKNGHWMFEGTAYGHDSDIIDILLERKKQQG